jgi:hypothetical protein
MVCCCGLSACLLLAGCKKDGGSIPGVHVDCQVAPSPPKVGPAKITVTLKDDSGKPITGAAIKVEGNMNHAGMKPVFGEAKERRPGQYETPLEFTMGGDWFLLINATLSDGRKLNKQVDVPGVKSR